MERSLDKIMEDMDWVTNMIARAEPDDDITYYVEEQEYLIREMNNHPDTHKPK